MQPNVEVRVTNDFVLGHGLTDASRLATIIVSKIIMSTSLASRDNFARFGLARAYLAHRANSRRDSCYRDVRLPALHSEARQLVGTAKRDPEIQSVGASAKRDTSCSSRNGAHRSQV